MASPTVWLMTSSTSLKMARYFLALSLRPGRRKADEWHGERTTWEGIGMHGTAATSPTPHCP